MNKLSFAIITCATSVAFAQGAGSGAAKAPEAKKAPAADSKAPVAPPKAEPPKKMEAPKPPAEVAELAKTLVGTWKCTGQAAMDPADMTKMTPNTNTISFKLDLDKFWLVATLNSKMFKGTMFTTFDTNSKKWYRFMGDNMGASQTEWSAGLANNKIVWDGEGRGMGMKPWKTRTTEDMISAKEVKMTGEMSMDGKTWMKGWESTCKK